MELGSGLRRVVEDEKGPSISIWVGYHFSKWRVAGLGDSSKVRSWKHSMRAAPKTPTWRSQEGSWVYELGAQGDKTWLPGIGRGGVHEVERAPRERRPALEG